MIAYLNRMGQFFYFVKSDFIKKYLPNSNKLIPKINELILFRHKGSSKRNIDLKNRDKEEYKTRQAFSLLGIQTIIILNKQQYSLPIKNKK